MGNDLAALAAELVRLDSRSAISNLAVAERIEAELAGFEVERLDYADAAGVAKRVLVAHPGGPGRLAAPPHMDTVPARGWADPPRDPRPRALGPAVAGRAGRALAPTSHSPHPRALSS